LKKRQYSKAVQVGINILEKVPYSFFAKQDYGVLYNIVWALNYQSKYSEQDILNLFEAIAQKHPSIKQEKVYKEYKQLLEMRAGDNNQIRNWQQKNLEEIIKLASNKNIQVILMTYPAGYTETNEIIRSLSKKYSLPIIDQYHLFEQILTTDSSAKYIEDDEHPSPAGYALMAKHTLQKLQEILP